MEQVHIACEFGTLPLNFVWNLGENWIFKGGNVGDFDLRADTFPLYVGFLVNRVFERLSPPASKFSIRLEYNEDVLFENELNEKDFIEGWNSDLVKEKVGENLKEAIFLAEELKIKKKRFPPRLQKSNSLAELGLLITKYPSLSNLKL